MAIPLIDNFKKLSAKEFFARYFASALHRAVRPVGCTVTPTDDLDRLRLHHIELYKKVEQLEKLLAAEMDRHSHPDYQLIMAQQSLLASFDDLDPGFRPITDFVKPYTMTSLERQYDLFKSVEYISKAKIPGDLVECGVWRGGSMMLAARTLLALGDTQRKLFLFDTYEGHPKPDAEEDVDLWGNRAADEWVKYRKTDETSDWAYIPEEEVRANMESTGYPMDNVVLVKGMVEATAAACTSTNLALVRLDTDWYASAKASLEAFWARLAPRGVLIIDDYGHYRGQRKAVDEFFATEPVLLHRVDYSCRSIVKSQIVPGG